MAYQDNSVSNVRSGRKSCPANAWTPFEDELTGSAGRFIIQPSAACFIQFSSKAQSTTIPEVYNATGPASFSTAAAHVTGGTRVSYDGECVRVSPGTGEVTVGLRFHNPATNAAAPFVSVNNSTTRTFLRFYVKELQGKLTTQFANASGSSPGLTTGSPVSTASVDQDRLAGTDRYAEVLTAPTTLSTDGNYEHFRIILAPDEDDDTNATGFVAWGFELVTLTKQRTVTSGGPDNATTGKFSLAANASLEFDNPSNILYVRPAGSGAVQVNWLTS